MILLTIFTFLCLLSNTVSSFTPYRPKDCTYINWTVEGRKKLSAQCTGANFTEIMEFGRDQEMQAIIINGCNPPVRRIKPLPNMSVTILWLENCGIEEIADDAFANITGTVKLDLSHNSIRTLPNLETLTDLSEVFLENNKIGNISDSQNFMKNKLLTYINLRNNALVEVTDETFSGFASVEHLDLGANQISAISPDAFIKLPKLSSLNLGNNNISTLPQTLFKNLTSLSELVLSNNQLDELPPTIFQSTTSLHNLQLNNNRITELPPAIFDSLTVLENLDLENNRLTKLTPAVFESLTELKTLNLNNNTLKKLPSNVFSTNKNMDMLWICYTDLEYLPNNTFKEMTNIRKMEIHHNKLKSLDENVFPASKGLSELRLNENQLEQIPALRNLPNLRDLSLENNRLKTLPTGFVRESEWINGINLNNNRIEALSDTVFSHLTVVPNVIDLRHNNLATVPKSAFGVCKHHRNTILLHGNPINCDEKLAWLVNDVKKEALRVSNRRHPEIPLCAEPPKHSGLPMQNIKID